MSDINSRIQRVIAESGLTKTAFAAKLNVSQQHVHSITEPCQEQVPFCLFSKISP